MSTNAEFCANLIKEKLAGATVVGSVVDPDNEYFGIRFRQPDGKELTAWIDCDAEGNGAGWINIE